MGASGSRGGWVVGVAGGTASGKTTLVDALRGRLEAGGAKVERFTLDRFFRNIGAGSPTITLPSSGEVLPDRNHPESADDAAAAEAVREAAGKVDIVLVEGHLVLHLERLREIMDLKVFLDLDDDARAMRRMIRDLTNGRGRGDPKYIAEYYLTCAKVGHDRYVAPSRKYADVILRGDAALERNVELLATLVEGRPEPAR